MANERITPVVTEPEARITSVVQTRSVPPPVTFVAGSSRSRLRKATDFIEDSSRIGFIRTHYLKYRRYALLEKQAIYDSLVVMYTGLFIMNWQHFRRFMEYFRNTDFPGNVNLPQIAAQVYISTWFIDLYVSNRDAVRKLTSIAYAQHYQHDLNHLCSEYDEYLVLLNAIIRPSHVKLASEDALYIPLISETPDWTNATSNFFGINNFTFNLEVFYGLIEIMKQRNNWNMSTLIEDTLGKPTWLFDWHADNQAYTWFPQEGNFAMEDVTIVYILGVSCTPKLGPRDKDDWQTFPDGIAPAVINLSDYERVTPQCFFGSCNVRTYERDIWILPSAEDFANASQKRARTASGTTKGKQTAATSEPTQMQIESQDASVVVSIQRIRLIDWVYYGIVILNHEAHTRTGALRQIVLN